MTISLVAHRGDCQWHIENTLQSIKTAILQGIKLIEIDVQLSQDGVPVLFHDRSLLRMTGVDQPVASLDLQSLKKLKLINNEHQLTKPRNGFITALSEVVALLDSFPDVTLFVEVKRVNFLHFTYRDVFNKLIQELTPISAQVVLISFSYRFLRVCKQCSTLPLGYVLPAWHNYCEKMLTTLQPQYLYCDVDIVPPGFQFSDRECTWVLYEIADRHEAMHYYYRGIRHFETFYPSKLQRQLQTAGLQLTDEV
ncbi:glycerophosphodiester phosphodiesterase family protein [Thalassotalea sp. ND16A]|uniref:glycerophosphodiester phosphodiesterase family protein n=1 Tax=Thalassotalea sp. ND16A TaxID=1535422 RepID=UPI00051A11B1|nr:glycerophosphodiester phosphodiesterase family protein [Thalassotalea sp. ND16A]KGJ95683.1 hypothetical protein ND16A_1218 [Thalassotalea sp. ND16A]